MRSISIFYKEPLESTGLNVQRIDGVTFIADNGKLLTIYAQNDKVEIIRLEDVSHYQVYGQKVTIDAN